MSDLVFEYIGWCKEGIHDKVWTAFRSGTTWYAAWGRRGGKLSFKKHETNRWDKHAMSDDLSKLISKKTQKYKEVDAFQLFAIFPDFNDKVERELMFKVLTNKIK